MAAKEKKSAISKQLKDNKSEKLIDSTKLRRGKRASISVLNDGKSVPEPKSPVPARKKKKENSLDGRTTPNTRKRRNAADVEEEHEAAKTPPPAGFKSKKTFLEKELEDILENATGRNTPSTPRSRKVNEKEEENGESDKHGRTRKGCSDGSEAVDDKGLVVSKTRKGSEKDDDDDASVRSFSTLRTRKNADKDVDDDALSVKSMSLKSKKAEVNNEDSASVASLGRASLSRKKKAVPAIVKKKMFLKRGRPKKRQADSKGKGKKKAQKKGGEETTEGKEKTIINKSIKYQNLIGTQRRLRSTMLLKKQKLRSAGLEEKNKQPRGLLIPVGDEPTDGQVKMEKDRLKLDGQNVKTDLDGDVTDFVDEPKRGSCKRKFVKKEGGKKGDSKFYYCPEGETMTKASGDKMNQKMKQTKMKLAKKLSNESKKRKRVPRIHYETTSSPDDSSVIIVQPRLGPKMNYARLKQLLINQPGRKVNGKEPVPKSVVPIATSAAVSNFNQIGGSYFVQSIPNFKLLATNSTIIRSYNTNPNFDSSRSVSANDLSYVEESERALATFGPKVSPNDIIVTPSGIVLSSSRLITGSNQPNICINGPNTTFLSETSNSNILYAQKSVGNVSKLFYQNSSNIIQPQKCTKTTTAILVERPESVSTSVISTTTTGTVVINSDGSLRLNGDVGKLKGSKGTEKDSDADGQKALEVLPMVPVTKTVDELHVLKNKSEKPLDKTDEKNNLSSKFDNFERRSDKRGRRMLRNVRQNHSSVSELTFSEPENSCSEKLVPDLYKAISCERLDRSLQTDDTNVLLQLGSEPMPISESIAPFETASAFLLDNAHEKKLKIDLPDGKDESPKAKGAVEVCSFSKENTEALKELGLDSDPDQAKSEIDPEAPAKGDDDSDLKCDSDHARKERMKEEVDNVLKEMPTRKIPNLLRKSDCFSFSKSKVELKTPLVLKNNDYLTKSPLKPPTVIDKLLERNKSLKKAEQESKYQNSMRNLSENLDNGEMKRKRSLREVRTRRYAKGEQRRLVANKRFINTNSGCKVFERRGSNPELYSTSYLTAESNVSNENVPLRRAIGICETRDEYQRRGSIDFESIQKVMDRRNSLPVSSDKSDDARKVKTDNIKTIVISSSSPLTSKNHGGENQTKVINIITEDDGSKKGGNLMEEIGMEIEKGAMSKSYVNDEKELRRTSIESSNSESESLKKLMDDIGVTKGKKGKEVPYPGENNSSGAEKISLSLDGKSPEEKKGVVIEESPEDLVTKETILSALGLQRAAAHNTQRKDGSGSSESGNYTGTLKTVIKIHRQEKKGNSKALMKMVYKASSNSSSASGQNEESNLDQDVEVGSKEDATEETKNGNGKAKSLVIPEKASSFSIHPGRMCSDVCTYCFGKFGLLDTPCHIAQLKDAHKRRNILETETHLLADSCLCDACFRHIDKKSNCPTFTEKKIDRRKFSGRKQVCCARNCNVDSQHNVRRKWFAKLKKSIGRKIVLDQAKLEKLQPAQFVTLCNRHFYWVDYFMTCGICKKRLTSVNMCRVGPDVLDLNAALSADRIPTILTEERFLCKLCHCYASIRMKCKEPSEMNNSQLQFYETCRKRILQCYEIEAPDWENEGERESRPMPKGVKKTRKSTKPTATVTNEGSKSDEMEFSMEELDKGGECVKDNEMKEVSHMNIPPKANGNLDFGGVSITPSTTEVNPTQIHVKLGNLNIGALGNLNIGQDVRHGTRSSDMQCFPTEAELALRAHFDLKPSSEDESAKNPRKGFEKCTTTIQFNPETKNLFYSLQMPYGNHSSFFRHLILLEKYFRNGDLVISRNADPKAINYISSVQNRIKSYEGIHNPVKKPLEIPPSLSILPQPIKTEARNMPEIQPSVIQSRPFTLTPMPSTFPKNSPLSHMQATVQNIPAPNPQSQGFKSLLKSKSPSTKPPKPELSITSVPPEPQIPARVGKGAPQAATAITSKIQENLRNLASKSRGGKQPGPVLINRTVRGQQQSLVQITTGGRMIHLTLCQFRRIQMQMRKKLEQQAKALKMKAKEKPPEEGFDIKNISPELEIQEIKPNPDGSESFPLISEVRSLAGEENSCWDKNSDGTEQASEGFPKIPKALSVSVTKIPPAEQSVEPVE